MATKVQVASKRLLQCIVQDSDSSLLAPKGGSAAALHRRPRRRRRTRAQQTCDPLLEGKTAPLRLQTASC